MSLLSLIFLLVLAAPAENIQWYKIRLFEKFNSLDYNQWSFDIRQDSFVHLNLFSSHPKGLWYSSRKSECISTGGDYVFRIDPTTKASLDKAVLEASIEQKALVNKKVIATPSSPSDYFKIEIGDDKKLNSVLILDRTKPSVKTMMDILDQVYLKALKNPAHAIKLTFSVKENIVLTFQNIGKLPVNLPLPDEASDSFRVLNHQNERLPSFYTNPPNLDSVELKPGQSYLIQLKIASKDLTHIKEVRYQNHSILHHAPKSLKSIELSLCARR